MGAGIIDRRLHPQRLVEAVIKELKLLNVFISKHVDQLFWLPLFAAVVRPDNDLF